MDLNEGFTREWNSKPNFKSRVPENETKIYLGLTSKESGSLCLKIAVHDNEHQVCMHTDLPIIERGEINSILSF